MQPSRIGEIRALEQSARFHIEEHYQPNHRYAAKFSINFLMQLILHLLLAKEVQSMMCILRFKEILGQLHIFVHSRFILLLMIVVRGIISSHAAAIRMYII